MCEDCKSKVANVGSGERGKKKRWCHGCARVHPGAVTQNGLELKVIVGDTHRARHCEDCGLRRAAWGLPLPGLDGLAHRKRRPRWCAECARQHAGAVKASIGKPGRKPSILNVPMEVPRRRPSTQGARKACEHCRARVPGSKIGGALQVCSPPILYFVIITVWRMYGIWRAFIYKRSAAEVGAPRCCSTRPRSSAGRTRQAAPSVLPPQPRAARTRVLAPYNYALSAQCSLPLRSRFRLVRGTAPPGCTQNVRIYQVHYGVCDPACTKRGSIMHCMRRTLELATHDPHAPNVAREVEPPPGYHRRGCSERTRRWPRAWRSSTRSCRSGPGRHCHSALPLAVIGCIP
jgi:hypothetical protein